MSAQTAGGSKLFSALRTLAAAGALCLWACIGGTGTDTDNGITSARAVDAEGRPLAGVVLRLHMPGFRPDSGVQECGLLAPLREGGKLGTLRTDASGQVRFRLAGAGIYVVEGFRNDTVLFWDSLQTDNPSVGLTPVFRMGPVKVFRGAIRLASGMRVDSGAVFVRGTGAWARLSDSGAYDLGVLPEDIASMAVGLRYSAAPVGFRIAEQGKPPDSLVFPVTGTPKPVFACREISEDSAKRIAAVSALRATEGPAAASDTVKLDSARVRAASRACDSLEAGTQVNVKVPNADTLKDSVTVTYVVVSADSMPKDTFAPGNMVPQRGCLTEPGKDVISYDLAFEPGPDGGIVVSDVSEACLNKP